MEIRNQTVLITGASRGIGLAFAKCIAQDKTTLHLVARRFENKDELSAELKNLGASDIIFHEVDLSNLNEVKKFSETIANLDINILFNNAGSLTGGLLENQNADEIASLIQINVTALMLLTRAVLPGMLKRNHGKIINNSSVSAIMNFPCASVYAASKAAVLAFTRSLGAELKTTNVSTLVLITPGIKTKMYDDISSLYGDNLDLSTLSSMPVKKYAEIIREAVQLDLEESRPHGVTGALLRLAQVSPKVFEKLVLTKFKR